MIKKILKSGGLFADGMMENKSNPFNPENPGFLDISGFHLDEIGALTKWQGIQKYNPSIHSENVFTSILDYVKSNGTRKQITSCLTGVYVFNSPTFNQWNAISLANCGGARTGGNTDFFDNVVLNDILYLCNGKDQNIKYDGTTAYAMGITAPSVVPTTSLGGTGITATTGYQYKYTYYNNVLGHESNPSQPSTGTGAFSNKTITVTVTCSPDPQVTQINIYRTVDGGAVWLYDGVISNIVGSGTTTFTDNYGDGTLGIAVDEFGNGVPPIAWLMEIYKGVVLSIPKNSSRVYLSKAGFPNAVDSNDFRDLDKNDGDINTGLIRLGQQVIVFKQNSIWNGSGDDRYTFGFNRQVTGTGCMAPWSIVQMPTSNTVIFLSKNGFYTYNGISTTYLSLPIEKTFKSINQSRLSQVYGKVYKKKNLCVWVVPSGSNTENDLLLTYDYIQNKWGTRTISNTHAGVLGILEDSSNGDSGLYLGGYNGFVYQIDSSDSDDGNPVTCYVKDRAHPKIPKNAGAEMMKSFFMMIVWFAPQSGTTISVSCAIDDPNAVYQSIGTIDCSNATGQGYVRFDMQGKRIFPQFYNAQSGQPLTIRGWQLHYQVLGRMF